MYTVYNNKFIMNEIYSYFKTTYKPELPLINTVLLEVTFNIDSKLAYICEV